MPKINIQVKINFFASLREELQLDETTLNLDMDKATVTDVWVKATQHAKIPNNVLIAINQEYVSAKSQVKDGDEVAFFPPVTGG